MRDNAPLPDEPSASPPQHQSFWFPVAPESRAESSQDEPAVPLFALDAAQENTTPAEPPPGGTTPSPGASYADRAAAIALGDFDSAECRRRIEADGLERLVMSAPADVPTANTSSTDTAVEINPAPSRAGRDYSPQPTANDETVWRLREHIVPVPMPPDYVDDEGSATTIARADAAEHDPDFQEVRRESAPLITLTADFLEMDRHPPKGAEAAHAPSCAVPVDRDDATPNDGVVPQEIVPPAPPTLPLHFGTAFNCALWSNGRFQIHTSDGEHVLLTAGDARLLLRYVSDVLSTRVRAEA